MQTKWWGWGAADRSYPLDRKPQFWPFLEATIGAPLPEVRVVDRSAIALRSSRLHPEHRVALEAILGRDGVSTLPEDRLLHSYGKSYRDLLRIRRGEVAHPPDAVLYPSDHDQVQAVLLLAAEAHLRVIPFGGGTSVVGGVEVPPDRADEVFVTLDLSRMNRVLSVDPVSRTARIQGGTLGPDLERQLAEHGFMLGHTPQSFEFSTLGGWLATRSAGQASTRYGRIEDMVVALKLATPEGTLETTALPARADGPSLNQMVVGSEGILGVITEATMRLHPLPSIRDYRGFLLPSFEAGMAAIRDLLAHDLHPATLRLSDAHETEALFKLRETPTGPLADWVQRLGKMFITRGGAIDLAGRCMLLIGFEGDVHEVIRQWETARSRLRDQGALSLGGAVGRSWFNSRFDLPYLRDTLLDRGVMVDTLETAGEWSQLMALYQGVEGALRESLLSQGTPGFVMCHVSHVYPDGASLYFTFAARQAPGREMEQWLVAKTEATRAILAHGGALSHHHAIGLDHAPWIRQALGDLGVKAIASLKRALDPQSLMNPDKLLGPSPSVVPEEA